MSSDTLAAAKRAGENAEHEVFDVVVELEPTADSEHYDAVAETAIFPRPDLPFVGICVLGAGTVVEIKSTMAVYGSAQRRGRFSLRETQHDALLDAGGVYIFVFRTSFATFRRVSGSSSGPYSRGRFSSGAGMW
ncbi:hypothetical protein [Halorubrum ezzemoulense]|uniref:hypothetical protein n=1 Tax=Halorubrum ezzemoulense TaxID=337243 RepID=UPI0015C69206|nr:hypothetical protein [Halorubrum ezzemoulense]